MRRRDVTGKKRQGYEFRVYSKFLKVNGKFRNLNWRYLPYIRPIFQAYVREYPPKIWQNPMGSYKDKFDLNHGSRVLSLGLLLASASRFVEHLQFDRVDFIWMGYKPLYNCKVVENPKVMLVMLPAITIDYPFLSEYSLELIHLAILGAPTFSATLEPLEPWNRLLFCWKSLSLKIWWLEHLRITTGHYSPVSIY